MFHDRLALVRLRVGAGRTAAGHPVCGSRAARVDGGAVRGQHVDLAGGAGAGDPPQPAVDLVGRPPGRLGRGGEGIDEGGLHDHLPAENRFEDAPDFGELAGVRTAQQVGFAERRQHRGHDRRRVGVAGRLLFEGQRVADLHDAAPVDPADADVLVDLVVDLPHLRRLGDDGVAVDGRGQQAVERGGLGLERGVGGELERHRGAGVVPNVGEVDDAAFVADPHLVEHRAADDGVERLDEPRRVVPGRLFGRHELRGDAGLRGHLSLDHLVEGARHRGQRDRVHKLCTRRRRARRPARPTVRPTGPPGLGDARRTEVRPRLPHTLPQVGRPGENGRVDRALSGAAGTDRRARAALQNERTPAGLVGLQAGPAPTARSRSDD